jgi:hypothetical protein
MLEAFLQIVNTHYGLGEYSGEFRLARSFDSSYIGRMLWRVRNSRGRPLEPA